MECGTPGDSIFHIVAGSLARRLNSEMKPQIGKLGDSPFCSTAERPHSTQHVRTVHLASSRYVGAAY